MSEAEATTEEQEQAEATTEEQEQEQAYRIDTAGWTVHDRTRGFPTAWMGNSGEASVSKRMVDAFIAGFDTITSYESKSRADRPDIYDFDLGDVRVTDPNGNVAKYPGKLIRGLTLTEVQEMQGMIFTMLQARLADHA